MAFTISDNLFYQERFSLQNNTLSLLPVVHTAGGQLLQTSQWGLNSVCFLLKSAGNERGEHSASEVVLGPAWAVLPAGKENTVWDLLCE